MDDLTLAFIVIFVIAGMVLMFLGAGKVKKSPRQLKGRSMAYAGVAMVFAGFAVLAFIDYKDRYY